MKGTAQLRLQFQETDVDVERYSDADRASGSDDRRSTFGNAFVMSVGAISWTSKKQLTMAFQRRSRSTLHYVTLHCNPGDSVATTTNERLHMDCPAPITIHEDNEATIAMSRNPVLHKQTKHNNINYHFVQEKIQD